MDGGEAPDGHALWSALQLASTTLTGPLKLSFAALGIKASALAGGPAIL